MLDNDIYSCMCGIWMLCAGGLKKTENVSYTVVFFLLQHLVNKCLCCIEFQTVSIFHNKAIKFMFTA